MAILSKEESKRILAKALSFSKADECEVSLTSGAEGNIRYALNKVTTSGVQDDVGLNIESRFGKKSASTSVNVLTEDAIRQAVRRSEELARLAPENPEYVPLLGPQTYGESPQAWSQATADLKPEFRTAAAGASIKPCRQKNLTAAGFLTDNAGANAMMNSKGLFAYHRDTGVDFSVTIRTPDGTGSGWAQKDFTDANMLDTGKVSAVAIEKAEMSREPKAIEPGKYTVILEPAAVANLVGNMIGAFFARTADEGRSFMSKKGGGTKLGEKIVDERISLYSDPNHPIVPFSPWAGDGRPQKKMYWLKNGVVQNLFYDRYWAEKQGVDGPPPPNGGVIEGGDASVADLIKDTKKGILVTRLWYIRFVDPQTLLFTGLTRDGTFYIENGKIVYPIKNLRFNESPIIMLNNLEALGKSERFEGNLVPPMKVRDFTFTGSSDAV